MIDTVIILSGGLGTRLRPLTDTIPKSLLPISGKPIIEHIIIQSRKFGVSKVILSVGYKADLIKEYFGDGSKWDVSISYSIESEPLGTGGAIRFAARGLNKAFLLMWGDNLCDVDISALERMYEKLTCPVVMTLVEREDVENFGVAKLEGFKILGFVEKPSRELAPSKLINAGIFVMDPVLLSMLPLGKCSMEKDCFEKIAPLGKIGAFVHKGQWFPTDTLEKYTIANRMFCEE